MGNSCKSNPKQINNAHKNTDIVIDKNLIVQSLTISDRSISQFSKNKKEHIIQSCEPVENQYRNGEQIYLLKLKNLNGQEYIYRGQVDTKIKVLESEKIMEKIIIQGHGIWETNQLKYQGQFRDGYPNGHGQCQTKQFYYKGFWKKGLFHGEGKLLKSKDKENWQDYRGKFYKGLRHGRGCLLTSKVKIKCLWNEDKLHGVVLIQGEDFKYEGQMQNNQMNGYGIIKVQRDNEVDLYQGFFKQNKKTAFGYLKCSKKEYIGHWDSDKMHGEGVYTNQQKKVTIGRFKNGKLQQQCNIQWINRLEQLKKSPYLYQMQKNPLNLDFQKIQSDNEDQQMRQDLNERMKLFCR